MHTWEWIGIGLVLFIAVCAVVIWTIYKNPLPLIIGLFSAIWVQLKPVLINVVFPFIKTYFSKRNTAEIEAQMAECVRRGGRWDNFKKKCVETR